MLPVKVCAVDEVSGLAAEFGSVLSAGLPGDVGGWLGHPDCLSVEFSDSRYQERGGARFGEVKRMMDWGFERDRILVFCRQGISRSVAVAWGICVGRGWDPEDAIRLLWEAHPSEWRGGIWRKRPFAPNRLVAAHLEDLFGEPFYGLARRYTFW
jgi:hypothetical protein